MPIYEYRCPRCGLFSELVKMSHASAPASCPTCQAMAQRVISIPRLTTLSRAQRTAWERNEKSAHEPQRASRNSCCASPAGCAHKPRAPQIKRPWMLGH
jgi:putative FmdB family regulatory protein